MTGLIGYSIVKSLFTQEEKSQLDLDADKISKYRLANERREVGEKGFGSWREIYCRLIFRDFFSCTNIQTLWLLVNIVFVKKTVYEIVIMAPPFYSPNYELQYPTL